MFQTRQKKARFWFLINHLYKSTKFQTTRLRFLWKGKKSPPELYKFPRKSKHKTMHVNHRQAAIGIDSLNHHSRGISIERFDWLLMLEQQSQGATLSTDGWNWLHVSSYSSVHESRKHFHFQWGWPRRVDFPLDFSTPAAFFPRRSAARIEQPHTRTAAVARLLMFMACGELWLPWKRNYRDDYRYRGNRQIMCTFLYLYTL